VSGISCRVVDYVVMDRNRRSRLSVFAVFSVHIILFRVDSVEIMHAAISQV